MPRISRAMHKGESGRAATKINKFPKTAPSDYFGPETKALTPTNTRSRIVNSKTQRRQLHCMYVIVDHSQFQHLPKWGVQ